MLLRNPASIRQESSGVSMGHAKLFLSPRLQVLRMMDTMRLWEKFTAELLGGG